MFESAKLLLCRLLKIPPEPTDPMGAVNSVRVFRASRRYFLYKLLGWALASVFGLLLAAALCAFLALSFHSALKLRHTLSTSMTIELGIVALFAMGGALFKAATGFFLVRLDYEMRWYKLSDRSLRIREGVFTVKEMTMTFANIQNISVAQGPLQRLFGIYDLKVESAGGGAVLQRAQGAPQDASAPHIACFRGVDNPNEIMKLMRERLQHLQDAGLGHPEDERSAVESVKPPVVSTRPRKEALLSAIAEAKALRIALERAAAL